MFKIPVGLATKLGVVGTAVLAFAAALTPLLPGAGAPESKFFAALATVIGGITILGRMLQSAATLLNGPGEPTARAADDGSYAKVPVDTGREHPRRAR